jgi:AcrR family transcriptional regulator
MPTETANDRVLDAALEVFREQGYNGATLELVAQRAKVDSAALQKQYRDKGGLFSALIKAHSPLSDLEAAFDSIEGDSAEDIIRAMMRRMVEIVEQHRTFVDLAAMDVQANNGAHTSNLSTQLLPKALQALDKLKATGQLRPVSDMILARTLVSLLVGFIISDQMVPQIARVAMRFFPQRAWLDGMVDLLLYGVLEDDAR